jgi:hypothetical protein
MAKFIFTSALGEELSLTDGENFKLVNIDGQTSAAASLSTLVTGGIDGDTVNSAQAQPRTIVLDLRITDEVEQTKRELLQIIKLKQQATLTWIQNERELVIKGTVEDIELPRWTNQCLMQVTLHCSQPFWETAAYIVTELREFIALHYFTNFENDMLYFPDEGIPFGVYDTTKTQTYYNSGDVAVGLEIEIEALDTCTNPIIYDRDGNFFGCGYGSGNKQVVMQAGDIITINTRKNEKSVKLNGASILGKVKPSSTWLQLLTGDNTFSFNSDEDTLSNMRLTLVYKQLYI